MAVAQTVAWSGHIAGIAAVVQAEAEVGEISEDRGGRFVDIVQKAGRIGEDS